LKLDDDDDTMWNLKKKFRKMGKEKMDNVCVPTDQNTTMDTMPSLSSPSAMSSTPVDKHQHVPSSSGGQNLTLVELFQSQGCSSCPPTNDNIISLISSESQGENLVLTYEVTYWDYLGWEDTFGRKEFDGRQRAYAGAGGLSGRVYTPQVIVNGTQEGVGNRAKDLTKIIEKGRKVHPFDIFVSSSGGGRAITVTPSNGVGVGVDATVILVRYAPNPRDVDIKRGENRGRVLPHRNVVVGLSEIGTVKRGAEGSFVVGEERERGVERAVIVQAGKGGPILGAARI